MSIASEYAERIRVALVSLDLIIKGHIAGGVTKCGNLWVASREFEPADALAIADWIYEMFGERKPPTEGWDAERTRE